MDIYCQNNKTKPKKKPEAEKLGAESVESIWRRTSFQQPEYEAIGAARGRSQRQLHGKGNQNAKFQESLPVDYQPGDSRSDSQNRELHVPVCISVHTTSSINSSSSLRAIVRKRDSANCQRNCQQLRGRVMRPWLRLRPSSFSWRIEQLSKSRIVVSPHRPSSPLTIP
jgi:hypothetical protein